MLSAIWFLLVLIVSCWTYIRAARSGTFARKDAFRLADAAETVAAVWLRSLGWYPRIAARWPQLVRWCAVVYGNGTTNRTEEDPAFRWTARTFAMTAAGLAVAAGVWLAEPEGTAASVLLLVSLLVPLVSWRDLAAKVKRVQEDFVSELPMFIFKLSLLISAGESLQRAWVRASEARQERREHPLYAELAKTCRDMERGVPFAAALEEMHRRTGSYEAGALITTILMNYKRGGDAFALALQDSSRLLMEKKNAQIRMKGEEASAKLLLPMMMMLFAVMIVVAAPAVMMM